MASSQSLRVLLYQLEWPHARGALCGSLRPVPELLFILDTLRTIIIHPSAGSSSYRIGHVLSREHAAGARVAIVRAGSRWRCRETNGGVALPKWLLEGGQSNAEEINYTSLNLTCTLLNRAA